jgi:hypothetical protein
LERDLSLKNEGWYFTALISYFTSLAVESAGISAVVGLVTPTDAESTGAVAVESLVSVAVDPEPQAVNAVIAINAIIKIYFFIIVNIRNTFEINKFT